LSALAEVLSPSPRVLVIVQARMGSSRLPGKVALDVAGAPMLLRQLERIAAARTPIEVCVATTTLPEDDLIVDIARAFGARWHRGEALDCLKRHVTAATEAKAEIVVKIPSDCPLIDPGAIDLVVGRFLKAGGAFDYVSNLRPTSWPDGNDVEIMTLDALRAADREAVRTIDREHTTPFLWCQPERFRCENVRWPAGVDGSSSYRFTVDYPEDYVFVRAVYHELYRGPGDVFRLGEILRLLDEQPRLQEVNQRFAGRTWERQHAGELTARRTPAQLVGSVPS
jgi:spore coat polysaccharide biosynthesis protein SpsF